jgi:hypothetical protein
MIDRSDQTVWRDHFDALHSYIQSQNFRGYDPYDGLMGIIQPNLVGARLARFWMQFMKRFPLNLRSLLRIPKMRNPKAMALFLQALIDYDDQWPQNPLKSDIQFLFEWLQANRCNGFSGDCWGYPFQWYSKDLLMPPNTPSVVVTAFAGKAILRYYEMTQSQRALESLKNIILFFQKEIPTHHDQSGICFSYTPFRKDCIYNANMLVAELLIRMGDICNHSRWLELGKMATRFVLSKQKERGFWNYSLDPKTGIEKPQIDFHQGFILESLYQIKNTTYIAGLDQALETGARFYKNNQFNMFGQSKWRWPKSWPVDIHHQAQGIITFSLLSKDEPYYMPVAKKIAAYTLRVMRSQTGYYYQKWPVLMNRIPYMRWGQAWMLKALGTLVYRTKPLKTLRAEL